MKEKTKEPTLFDYLSDITSNKNYIYIENDPNKNYSEFMINRGLAQHVDTILLANEMNKKCNISKQMHFDYLFYSVDAKPRYGKWAKQNTIDTDLVEFLKEHYCVNQSVALEYLELFDKDDLQLLKSEYERKGGR